MKRIRSALAAIVMLALALAGCAGIPVSAQHPLGSAYAKIDETTNKDGSTSCHVEASGGLDVQALQLNASLCHGGDTFASSATGLVGSTGQALAAQAWETVDANRQAQIVATIERVAPFVGPLFCAGLVMFGAAVPAAVCGAAVAAGKPKALVAQEF